MATIISKKEMDQATERALGLLKSLKAQIKKGAGLGCGPDFNNISDLRAVIDHLESAAEILDI